MQKLNSFKRTPSTIISAPFCTALFCSCSNEGEARFYAYGELMAKTPYGVVSYKEKPLKSEDIN